MTSQCQAIIKGPYGRQCRNKVKIGVYCHWHAVEYENGVPHRTIHNNKRQPQPVPHTQQLTNRTTKPHTDPLTVLSRDIIQLIGSYLVLRDNIRFGLTCRDVFKGLINSVVWLRYKDCRVPIQSLIALQRVFPKLHCNALTTANLRVIAGMQQVHTLYIVLPFVRSLLLEQLHIQTQDIETLIIPSVTKLIVRLYDPHSDTGHVGHMYIFNSSYEYDEIVNVDFIACFRNLQTLYIESSYVLDNMHYMFAKLSKLRHLYISGDYLTMPSVQIHGIELCRELEQIELSKCAFNSSDITVLTQLPKLNTVKLQVNIQYVDSLAILTCILTRIHNLEVLDVAIRGNGRYQLPTLSGLVNLHTARLYNIDNCFDCTSQCPKLRNLSVQMCNVTRSTPQKMVNCNPNLLCLDIIDSTLDIDDFQGLVHLEKFTAIYIHIIPSFIMPILPNLLFLSCPKLKSVKVLPSDVAHDSDN